MTATGKQRKKAKLRHAEYYGLQEIFDKLYADSKNGRIFKDLMPLITAEENIKLAYRNIRKNKGSRTAGTDNRTIENLSKLSDERLVYLVQRKLSWYEPQPVRRVEIPKPNDPTKMRPLGIPTIMDRLIQQCVLQVLEPICEAKFHDNSHGFRPNRSTEHAIAQAVKMMQLSGLSFVVDIDIKGFFDNVSHGKLLKQMWTMGIRDKTLLSIISAMLKAEVAGIGFPEKGTPQGGVISPLLSNIVLNELDWWIASQWENMPTKRQYSTGISTNGAPIHSSRYGSLRNLTNLKECYIVRYADDFRIFCRKRGDAEKVFHAVQDWLKHRLGLEINRDKSQIVNLKKGYSEFLGFKMKLIRRGAKTSGEPKYIVKSHITDKSKEKIVQKARALIHDIEFHTDGKDGQYTAVSMYNSFVIGVHNYYNIATHVQKDFREIAFPIYKSLKARLRERLKTKSWLESRKIQYTIPKHIQEAYGKSAQLRFIGTNDTKVLVPIGYVSHKYPRMKARIVNKYTPEGRAVIHKGLERIDKNILHSEFLGFKMKLIRRGAKTTQILRFYLERSLRYGIFDEIVAREARSFLESIELGYSLQFRRSALIFDFEKNGTEAPENEVGIEFHRIGKDMIHALLENCLKPVSEEMNEELTVHLLSEQFIPSVPKLETAAFIAPKRERTTSWLENVLWEKQEKADRKLHETVAIDEAQSTMENVHVDEVQVEPDTHTNSQAGDILKKEERQAENVDEVEPETLSEAFGNKPSSAITEQQAVSDVSYDIMLGVNGGSPQYGLLGEVSGRKIALDLNHTHTISLFGVQGGGKSYTLGTVIEMASMPLERINLLPSPLATVIFHYSPTQDYAPEFTSMIYPNSVDEEIRILRERYKAKPEALKDVLILTPSNKVDERKVEYPGINVRPIAFSASELKAAHWKFLMGTVGSQSMYMRQINLIMRNLRDKLTFDALRNSIEKSGLSDHLKELAQTRLLFASQYINDNQRLQDLIRPGRLIIVDLRDEYIEKDEALGLFVVMLQIFSEATYLGNTFNKLVVFDEAHKYIENDDLVSGLVEVVREMRHKGTSIMVASQDPPSVPVSLIELSSQIIMHKFNSPAWLKHIQKANAALGELTSDKMSRLGTGEAYIWSSKASDEAFTRGAVKIKCRPRITQHGGSTKTAVDDHHELV